MDSKSRVGTREVSQLTENNILGFDEKSSWWWFFDALFGSGKKGRSGPDYTFVVC